jgi:hypothetical protein
VEAPNSAQYSGVAVVKKRGQQACATLLTYMNRMSLTRSQEASHCEVPDCSVLVVSAADQALLCCGGAAELRLVD